MKNSKSISNGTNSSLGSSDHHKTKHSNVELEWISCHY
jgi:hypothetical protein